MSALTIERIKELIDGGDAATHEEILATLASLREGIEDLREQVKFDAAGTGRRIGKVHDAARTAASVASERIDGLQAEVSKIRSELGDAPRPWRPRIWDQLSGDHHAARAKQVDELFSRDLLTVGDELAQAALLFERGLMRPEEIGKLRDLVSEWHRARAAELRT